VEQTAFHWHRLLGWFLFVLAWLLLLAPAVDGEEAKQSVDRAPAESLSIAKGADDPALLNMEFRDTELPIVLHAICQEAGLDFVLDPGVKGKVTAKLRNTTCAKALDIILKSHGFSSKQEGQTLVIAPSAMKDSSSIESLVRATALPDGKFDFDAGGADIREAVRQFASAAKRNVIASKDVSGTVTASLRGLSAEDVLAALADSCSAAIAKNGEVSVLVPKRTATDMSAETEAGTPAPRPETNVKIEVLPDGQLAIDAERVDLRDLFGELARAAKLNLLYDPQVSGTISLSLQRVSAEDLLSAVCAHANLVVRSVGAIQHISPAPREVQSETFQLRYADGQELSEILREAIDDAKIGLGTASNMLVVTGPPHAIAAVRQIVERVEKPPPQIAIETRIVETNVTADHKLGIDWNDSVTVDASLPTVPHSWPLRAGTKTRFNPGYDPDDTRSRGDRAVPYAETGSFKFGLIDATKLSFTLHMLDQERSTRMIANPVVTTVENKEAKVNIVTKYPIAKYQVSNETGLLTVSGFEYKEFGTILEVTPRVSDGGILLQIHPEVSRQFDETEFQGAKLPIIGSQEARTEVRIPDGGTLVIAGLIREDREERRRGVPLVSKIPVLGGLFRSKKANTGQQRNLLIFITPHIVREGDFARSARLKKEPPGWRPVR